MTSMRVPLFFISSFIVYEANSLESNNLPRDSYVDYSKYVATRIPERTDTGIILKPADIKEDPVFCRIACLHSRIFPITLTSGEPKPEDMSRMEVHLHFMYSGDNFVKEILIACNDMKNTPCMKGR
ncbi:hypothetical protein RF11_03432 [Thelohanellus kitauei]|uniref:Uncharacterized protein n=1 Tax=Thelohanellus kitauei TaxID=669202 RepID=A0A0C2MQJ4_THEKT|nr:hypothetical protein RF11_03432 [Thelohanellus kitauei]